ncbi:MAG: hypothetical protein QOJ65_2526 [Fimbriimonadaceae bacterium]|jgi:hypothetical protein|nr:hypothetical protein [Fimbriimonadaceae bacterium]
MKTGDKKQAIALTAVAVLAIGFLGSRLIPSKSATVKAVRAAEAAKPELGSDVLDLPLAVLGNPFSHPKLAVQTVKVDQAQTPAPKKPPKTDIDKGKLPDWAGDTGGDSAPPFDPGDPNSGTTNTEENAGETRKTPRGPRIRVIALMRVGHPLAMLAVNDGNSVTFGVGEKILDGVKLAGIGDSFVTVSDFGKLRRIKVGETSDPNQDQPK